MRYKDVGLLLILGAMLGSLWMAIVKDLGSNEAQAQLGTRLAILTDEETGCQYLTLSVGLTAGQPKVASQLVPRMKGDGTQVCMDVDH